MAKSREPTKAEVLGIAQRLQDLYAADELGHLEEGELFGAVRELHILARRAGFDLDDNHPVQSVLDTIYEYDEDLATDLLDDVRALEIRDRRMLAEAEAMAARQRVVNAAGEILERGGANRDELRSGLVAHLMRNTPIPATEGEAIEEVREIERAARATATTVEHADLRASILGALPASQSPFGSVHQARRQEAIQNHVVATSDWSADLDSTAPMQTHDEREASNRIMAERIVAASQGPVAQREFEEAHGLERDDLLAG